MMVFSVGMVKALPLLFTEHSSLFWLRLATISCLTHYLITHVWRSVASRFRLTGDVTPSTRRNSWPRSRTGHTLYIRGGDRTPKPGLKSFCDLNAEVHGINPPNATSMAINHTAVTAKSLIRVLKVMPPLSFLVYGQDCAQGGIPLRISGLKI